MKEIFAVPVHGDLKWWRDIGVAHSRKISLSFPTLNLHKFSSNQHSGLTLLNWIFDTNTIKTIRI